MVVMKNGKSLLLLLALAVQFGCVDSERQQASGDGTIRALGASSNAPDLAFRLGELVIDVAAFREVSAVARFDDLDYEVNFDYVFVGETELTRLITVPFTLVKDMDHLFIYTGTLAAPATILWQRPIRVWEGTETVMQIEFGHLSPQLGAVDVYLANPGTAPVLGGARATLTNGNHSAALELDAGDYELILTTSGDPADVLFTSTAFSFIAATSYLAVAFDGDPSVTSPISVQILRETGASTALINVATPPTLRAFHTAFGTEAFDLYRDSDFSAPLIANVANNALSLAVDVPSDSALYTFTPVGNIGATLFEEVFSVIEGGHRTRFLLGETAELSTILLNDDFRSLEDSAKFRVVQTSFNQQAVDFYVVEAGTDIADSTPRYFSLGFQTSSGYDFLIANSYELYATTTGTTDILVGPIAVDIADGDVVHFALVDTADPNVLELIEYDHRTLAGP